MKRAESENKKRYFVQLAEEFESDGLLVAASYIYSRYDRKKARLLMNEIAKKAHLFGFYTLAAEAHRRAGHRIRAANLRNFVKSWRGLHSEGENGIPLRKMVFATTRFEREGMFSEARRYWADAARFCEISGNPKLASIYYMKAGETAKSKRIWMSIARERPIMLGI